ncbi:hypothetical protein EUX98_g5524 [Antrodiella citrinella]|uniref:Uncharacterized protein n=1 Tax=Antrodiella citrinella TaxID=2447956 RepID=A0A4S4MT79_9APHY|nr:hypothetical protein EUX98_g5524 [Antrodiella citrinella]
MVWYWPWTRKRPASRKFIDLIHAISLKWANWEPSKHLEVGDFGTIDQDSGLFEREGNIYSYSETKDAASKFPVQLGDPEDEFIAKSMNSKRINLAAGVHADLLPAASAEFTGRWQFDSTRGALLVLVKPRLASIPNEFFRPEDIPKYQCLRGKHIITEVHTCPAFALCYSTMKGETVDLTLRATVPAAAGVSVGPHASFKWEATPVSGLSRFGSEPGAAYYPLLTVKEIRQPGNVRRDSSGGPQDSGDVWADVEVPWGYLDEDGDEETE